jgi:hypothetical protein
MTTSASGPGILIALCLIILLAAAGCTTTQQPAAPATTAPVTAVPADTVPATTPATEVPVTTATEEPVAIATTAAPFNHFTSDRFAFGIDYPADWTARELNAPETAISSTRYDVVEFYSPSFLRCNSDKTECVNVRAEVRVEADTNPSSTELDTFFVKEVARVTTESNVEITKRDAMFRLAGDKAYRLDYKSADTADEHINALSAYAIRNGVGYIITYHGHAPERQENTSQFELYYNDVMQMFDSFELTAGNYKTI